MDDHDVPALLPVLSLTVGNTDIKPVLTPEYDTDIKPVLTPEYMHQSMSSPEESDPNNSFFVNKKTDYLSRGSELWHHFQWLGGQGKMSLMRCNYCIVNKQLKNAPKCRRHLIKCPKTPEAVRKYFEKKEVEANRVSALMRELRSKEIKVERGESINGHHNNNNKPPSDQKLPVPTANDLKHLQLKQHQASINNVIVTQNSPLELTLNRSQAMPINSKPLLNGKSNKHEASANGHHTSRNIVANNPHNPDNNNLFNELSLFYQQIMQYNLQPNLMNMSETIDLSKPNAKSGHLNGNGVMSSKLKRKHSPARDAPNGANFNGNTNKENKDQHNSALNNAANSNNTTVVINLDDVNALDASMFFNPNGISTPAVNGSRKKKRESVITNGRHEAKNGNAESYRCNNGNGFHANFSELNSSDLEIVHDDLNDLLASALMSGGVEFDFISNSYFQKFITQLVSFSGLKGYRLPSVDKLSTVNLNNLVRKFDYETAKIFSECDSIIISFDWSKESSNQSGPCKTANVIKQNASDLDVNMLISSSNIYSQLFFKTISCQTKDLPGADSANSLDNNLKLLNSQIDSMLKKIGPARINAVILPYDEGKSSEMINSYLTACHSHIVPLTNSYQLFHHLLCDICKIPSIHKLLNQCISLFKELAYNFDHFQEENQKLWKHVFESDNLKLCKHLLKPGSSSAQKNTYWISLNLMLCWFLVAKESIAQLFCSLAGDEHNSGDSLNNLLENVKLEADQIEQFFGQISVLFNFLTPFITAIHLIENESSVISDIIKIYFDVKLAINNNNFFDGIGVLCNKMERHSIDCILHKYLQEQNFSKFFFLTYYLDPRFRSDKRIEENEELIAQVYDTLFSYANAIGCMDNEEDGRYKLADSLGEFRNADKLYGMQLLKCPKSPLKFWKHLRRFPASSKLAFCASRLMSISTRSMLMATPLSDKCTSSLNQRIAAIKDLEVVDSKAAKKILPIKSYLMSQCEQIPSLEEDDISNNALESDGKTESGNGADNSPSHDNLSTIISNVITSLDHYSLTIAQPFTSNDLSCLLQPSN